MRNHHIPALDACNAIPLHGPDVDPDDKSLETAKKFLPVNDRGFGISPAHYETGELEAALQTDRFNFQESNSGEIFRQYRVAGLYGNENRKTDLFAKFLTNKRVEISKLEARVLADSTIGTFNDALSSFTCFKGLWLVFQVGQLYWILGLRKYDIRFYDPVLKNY